MIETLLDYNPSNSLIHTNKTLTQNHIYWYFVLFVLPSAFNTNTSKYIYQMSQYQASYTYIPCLFPPLPTVYNFYLPIELVIIWCGRCHSPPKLFRSCTHDSYTHTLCAQFLFTVYLFYFMVETPTYFVWCWIYIQYTYLLLYLVS